MITTYYLITATGVVARATTPTAKKKLWRLSDTHPGALKPLSPKEAKQLITAGREYWKIKNVM